MDKQVIEDGNSYFGNLDESYIAKNPHKLDFDGNLYFIDKKIEINLY